MRYYPIILSILFPIWLLADNVALKAYVSANEVGTGQQFQYSVEISGSSSKLPPISFPDFSEFFIHSGPNTSTSIQMVNGVMSSTKTYSFILQPKREGELKISPATVKVNGKQVSSNSITIKVSKSPINAQGKKQSAPVDVRDNEIGDKNVFFRTWVSARNCYIGEQIIVEYRLYFRVNIRGYELVKIPSNPGFWSEEFQMPSQPPIHTEVINGINYNVATLRKIAVFPTRAGELKLEPMEIKLEAVVQDRSRRRSIFDSFFDDPFGKVVSQTVTSKAVKINVSEFPTKDKPDHFDGTVGDYKFIVGVDKTNISVNEAISLKMTVQGVGNIKLVNLPVLTIPPDIEQYEPKIRTDINNKGKYINGSKQSESILIPRVPGEYQIKPVTFSFFNPSKRKYETITSQPLTIHVTGEQTLASGGTITGSGYSRQEISLLGKDIRFIKESADFFPLSYRPYLSPSFWVILFGMFISFLAFVFYNEHQVKIQSNIKLARSRKAGKIASRHLALAKKKVDQDDQYEFYKAISSALRGFVQDRLGLELTDFNSHSIQKVLSEKGIDEEVITTYTDIVTESDFRQFANIQDSKEARRDFFEKARMVLTKLEKWI
ncbi:MAG: protein BatD [Calditrichaceae bacterium]|nr:protein BatD [Calditrichaceae bacterium]MBN2707922.1 protein BatD [Calditrichaceae bacterium]RQV92314.1 MAG: protein BatD [Calditrichota bacterium]